MFDTLESFVLRLSSFWFACVNDEQDCASKTSVVLPARRKVSFLASKLSKGAGRRKHCSWVERKGETRGFLDTSALVSWFQFFAEVARHTFKMPQAALMSVRLLQVKPEMIGHPCLLVRCTSVPGHFITLGPIPQWTRDE